jgi:hypothetical protein
MYETAAADRGGKAPGDESPEPRRRGKLYHKGDAGKKATLARSAPAPFQAPPAASERGVCPIPPGGAHPVDLACFTAAVEQE